MESLGPGPAYSLPSTVGYEKHDLRKTRSPQYTMAGRLKDRNVTITPGPGLNTQGLTRRGRPTNYVYSIAPRLIVKDSKNLGPGPANYDLSKSSYVSNIATPSYSFGRRHNYRFKNLYPAPNAYGVHDRLVRSTTPAYSIGIKTEVKTKDGSPGPASYTYGNMKTTFKKAPEYSMSTRLKPTDKMCVPGANAYNRMSYKPGKSSPSYTFGVRHSPRAPPMIVACDKV